MGKDRVNITAIAEVLIDEIDALKLASKRMELIPKQLQEQIDKEVKIDIKPLNQHLEIFREELQKQNVIDQKRNERSEAILREFKELSVDNNRIPVPMALWLIATSIGSIYGIYSFFSNL